MPKGFEPGHPKMGGRVKGTPNKRTQLVGEICEEYNFDPIRAMIQLFLDSEDANLKAKLASDVAQYVYTKKKSLEHEISIQDVIRIAKEALNESES